jgi:hypothetical protein
MRPGSPFRRYEAACGGSQGREDFEDWRSALHIDAPGSCSFTSKGIEHHVTLLGSDADGWRWAITEAHDKHEPILSDQTFGTADDARFDASDAIDGLRSAAWRAEKAEA